MSEENKAISPDNLDYVHNTQEENKGIPFALFIHKVEPAVLVQGRSVYISFSLINYSGKATSGTVVSNFGGEAPISNLANGAATLGSLTFTAPKAGENIRIVVQFFETDAPIVGEFPQSSTDTTISVKIGTGYILEVTGWFGTFTNPPFPHDPNSNWTDLFGGKTFPQDALPAWQWTPLLNPLDEFDDKLVGISGTAVYSSDSPLSTADVPFLHPFGFDYEFFIAPDPPYVSLLAPNNLLTGTNLSDEFCAAVKKANDPPPQGLNLGAPGLLNFEVERDLVPLGYRAQHADRVAVYGRWIVDTGHNDFHTEIHPPLLLASARAISQNTTHSTVVGRPYLVSQDFGDGGLRQHLINEIEKVIPIPPFEIPRSTHVEARPQFLEPPFSGTQIMAYLVRPPSPRQKPEDMLQVQFHFTVRSGVVLQVINDATEDAVKVVIAMYDSAYTAPPRPPKHDWNISLDDLDTLEPGLGTTIKDVLFGIALLGSPIAPDPLGTTIALSILSQGVLTDRYDAPQATSVHDLEVTTVTVDKLGAGPHFSVDDSQPFPVYGWLDVQWMCA